MRPLLLTPITREQHKIGDWIDSATQLTDAGRADFWRRQQERIAQKQGRRPASVSPLKVKP